jgi:hypothetical protein
MLVYAKIVATIALVLAGFGFAVPMAVSAKATALVVLGLGLAALVPVAIYYVWENEIGQVTEFAKKNFK